MEIKNFLSDLQLSPARDAESMIELLKKYYSEKKANRFFNKWFNEVISRGNKNNQINDSDLIYSIMNEDYHSSLALTGGWNYDRYVYQGEWIEDNKLLFGNSILDIGCQNGIMTCFLAKLFPEASVVGIDKSKSNIAIAKRLAKETKLNNVKFAYVSLSRYSGQFNTVFTSYLFHETFNINYGQEYLELLEEQQIEHWCNELNPCISKIASLLEPKGKAICFERYYKNIALCGLLKAFKDNNLLVDEQYFHVKSGVDVDDVALYVLSLQNCDDIDYYRQYQAFRK